MITLTAGEIALLVGGELHCDKDLLVSKAPVFDSRLATPGCIFLALKGEKVMGMSLQLMPTAQERCFL